MKDFMSKEFDQYKLSDSVMLQKFGLLNNEFGGCFTLKSPIQHRQLFCIVGKGKGWEHVSVSSPGKIPLWEEMDFVKNLFFHPNEVVWQYHINDERKVNINSNVLHLWRKENFEMPLPPKEFV